MKEIKKSASFTSKQKGKDVKFNIDLNYSPEYDSFIIKVKEGEGFMSYSSNIERMPLEVIQKLNEMLEEVLIKAGSEYEKKEHKMSNGGDFQAGVYEWGGRFQTQDTAEELIKDGYGIYEAFESYKDAEDNCNIEDLRSGKVIIVRINNSYCLAEKRKMLDGGDFQAGVYNKGGALKNERLHVNKDEDYEVRYSKPRPHRKGYKGLRNFEGGGGFDFSKFLFDDDGNPIDLKVGDMVVEFRKKQPNQPKSQIGGKGKIIQIIDAMAKVSFEPNNYEQFIALKDLKKVDSQKTFADGGEMDLTDDKRLRVRKPVMPERKMSEQEWAEKHNPRAYEYMTKRKMATGGGVDSQEKTIFKYRNKLVQMNVGKDKPALDFSIRLIDMLLDDELVVAKGKPKKDTNYDKKIFSYRNELVKMNIGKNDPALDFAIKIIDMILDGELVFNEKMATGGGVGLVGNQKRIDMNKNGKIDAEDFKLLRSSMNGAWRNEHKHVNHNEDYEVRYAKPRPKRTGYKGKRNFMAGGKMEKCETGTEVKKGVKGGIMTLAKKIRKEGESWQDAVKKAGQQLK